QAPVHGAPRFVATLAQFRPQHAPVRAAGAVGQRQPLAAQAAEVGRVPRVALDAGDALVAACVARAVDEHAAADPAVAAGRARGAALDRHRWCGAIHQGWTSGSDLMQPAPPLPRTLLAALPGTATPPHRATAPGSAVRSPRPGRRPG